MKSFDCKQCKVSADRSIFLTNLFKKLTRKGEAQTVSATVLSRRLMSARYPTQGSTWDYLITFRLEDGSEVELFVSEEFYRAATPGVSGTLTRQGDELVSFA